MSENKKYGNNKQVAVVTGSSKGISKAIAIEFAKAGYSVVINARNEEDLNKTFEDISKIVGSNGKNDKVLQVA